MHSLTDTTLELGRALREKGWTACTAESCTGGLVAGAMTSVSGSSDWFVGGVVAYANEVKAGLLGVQWQTLSRHGAVSGPTVAEMAPGAARATGANVAVALSGIAGPSGGTPDKPVGTVWIGWSWPGGESQQCFVFSGDRDSVREQSVEAAIRGLLDAVNKA